MDIGSLSAYNLNASYVPFSAASGNVNFNSSRVNSFEDILRKTQDSNAASEADRGVSSLKKDEIDRNSQLYELCEELETFLIKNLIKSMRDTVQKSNLIDTGFAGEMYEDMLYDEYAKTFSRNANFGFAEMAYRELSKYS